MTETGIIESGDTSEKIRKILAGALFIPEEKIHSDDRLAALQDMDSLTFSNIIVEVEALIGKRIDPSDMIQLKTVQDLVALVEKNS